MFGGHVKHIASVSCAAARRDKTKTEEKGFIQGIEKFIDAMRGHAYTAIFLADPIIGDEFVAIRKGYESIYSTISPFRKETWSYNENDSDSVTESLSTGISKAVTDGISKTQASTKSIGANVGIEGVGGVNAGYARTRSKTDTHSETKTDSETTTHSDMHTEGNGRTLQIEISDKSIEEILARIDEYLKRIKESEDYGCYNCGAYFLSGKQESVYLAANTYRALMLGDGSSTESSAINAWNSEKESNKGIAIKEYLRRFVHPILKCQNLMVQGVFHTQQGHWSVD